MRKKHTQHRRSRKAGGMPRSVPAWAAVAVEQFEAHVELLTMAFCHKHGRAAMLLHRDTGGVCVATLGDVDASAPWHPTDQTRVEAAQGAQAWRALANMEPEEAVLVLSVGDRKAKVTIAHKSDDLKDMLRDEANQNKRSFN